MENQNHASHISTTDRDFWTCVCGNHPAEQGFYPCDENGKQVEPTPEEWKSPLYVCVVCGRIINEETLAVVGQNLQPELY